MKFELTYTFNVPANQLYAAWLDSVVHTRMTGGEAVIENKVGAGFTAWDEYISGHNLVLEEGKRIKQAWRTSQFKKDQEDSILELLFVAVSADTSQIVLKHSNLTEEDIHYRQGWIDHYFLPMEEYFSS